MSNKYFLKQVTSYMKKGQVTNQVLEMYLSIWNCLRDVKQMVGSGDSGELL